MTPKPAYGKTLDEGATMGRIMQLHTQGIGTRLIVKALAAEGHKTRRGTPWSRTQVQRVIARVKGKTAAKPGKS